MQKCNKSKVLEVILSVYLFFEIFCPPIFHIKIRVVLTIGSLAFYFFIIILKKEVIISKEILKAFSMYILFLFVFLIFQLIQILNTTMNKEAIINDTMSLFKIFIHAFSVCAVLTLLCKYYKLTYEIFMKALFNSSFIELILVILSFLNKNIRDFFNQTIIKNSQSDLIVAATSRLSYVRNYGFAENLFDGFGYIIAMIIGFTFLNGVEKKNIKIILFSIFMCIMPLLNTRTGLLLAAVAFLIVMFSYVNFVNIIKYIFVFIVVIPIGIFIFNQLPQATSDWVISGFYEVSDLLTGEGTKGTFNVILKKDLVFPKNIIIGAGCRPESFGIYVDSGYVQCIWRFGLIGTFFLFAAFLFYIFYIYKKANKKSQRVALLIIMASYFIYLFKLLGIINVGANVIIFGTPLITLLENYYNNYLKKDIKD